MFCWRTAFLRYSRYKERTRKEDMFTNRLGRNDIRQEYYLDLHRTLGMTQNRREHRKFPVIFYEFNGFLHHEGLCIINRVKQNNFS